MDNEIMLKQGSQGSTTSSDCLSPTSEFVNYIDNIKSSSERLSESVPNEEMDVGPAGITLPSVLKCCGIISTDVPYFLCHKKFQFSPLDRAYELFLRPDITEDLIMNLTEQVLFSIGGKIKPNIPSQFNVETENLKAQFQNFDINENNVLPARSIVLDLSLKESECSEVHVYLGVNSVTKIRALLIHFVWNTQTVKKSSKSMFQSGDDSIQLFENFSFSVFESLRTAFDEENILVMSMIDATGSSSQESQALTNNYDVNFVRDLQLSYSYDMFLNASTTTMPLDKHLGTLEKQCAKLMTLVNPSYVRCNFKLPFPPAKKSLKFYPLSLKRDPIAMPNIEASKLILFRAKKAAKKASEDKVVHWTLLEIHSQLLRWAEEESNIRIQRKLSSIMDRIHDIEKFRLELLWILHTRYCYDQLPVGERSLFPSETSEKRPLSNQDISWMNSISQRCRIFDSKEPILVDISVTLDGKKGSLYISANHLLFEPNITSQVTTSIFGSFFGFKANSDANKSQEGVDSEIIPLKTVISISIVDSIEKIVVFENLLDHYQSTNDIHIEAQELLNTPLPTSNEVIVIRCQGGKEYSLTCHQEYIDIHRRVADLLCFLIRHDLYQRLTALLASSMQLSQQVEGMNQIDSTSLCEHDGAMDSVDCISVERGKTKDPSDDGNVSNMTKNASNNKSFNDQIQSPVSELKNFLEELENLTLSSSSMSSTSTSLGDSLGSCLKESSFERSTIASNENSSKVSMGEDSSQFDELLSLITPSLPSTGSSRSASSEALKMESNSTPPISSSQTEMNDIDLLNPSFDNFTLVDKASSFVSEPVRMDKSPSTSFGSSSGSSSTALNQSNSPNPTSTSSSKKVLAKNIQAFLSQSQKK